jgi:hypothetical protein
MNIDVSLNAFIQGCLWKLEVEVDVDVDVEVGTSKLFPT